MARAAFAHAVRSNAKVARQRRHRLEHQDRHFTEVGNDACARQRLADAVRWRP